VLVACACGPFERRGPAWLVPRLLRVAAPRWAALLADELRRSDERLWEHALGSRYESVRRRYARRTRWKTGGVADVVAADERTLDALRNRLARWLAQGPDPATIAEELEAAIVSTRTPARMA
jgi:2-polyprenyl-6-methoxyphenol hydroxylase-like FAD-dependent oxidoreductase